eukprot:2993944-Heterocapsa_arctica.AAC.1
MPMIASRPGGGQAARSWKNMLMIAFRARRRAGGEVLEEHADGCLREQAASRRRGPGRTCR